MEPQDVEARLEGVLKQLAEQRDVAKRELDEAWGDRPEDCKQLIQKAAEALTRFLDFREVAQKALPLLSALDRIEKLRRDAVEQLDRLSSQAEESHRIKAGLDSSQLEGLHSIPPLVGESFDLSLLDQEQLRLIVEARKALTSKPLPARVPPPEEDLLLDEEPLLEGHFSPEPQVHELSEPLLGESHPEEVEEARESAPEISTDPGPQPIVIHVPPPEEPEELEEESVPLLQPGTEKAEVQDTEEEEPEPENEPESSSGWKPSPTTDVTLDELMGSGELEEDEEDDRSVLSLVMEESDTPEDPTIPNFDMEIGLPGDDELDAMFEEAVVSESAAINEAHSNPPPAPSPELPSPEVTPSEPLYYPPDAVLEEESTVEEDLLPEVSATEVPAPEAKVSKDPLEELLTRAGFEG